MSEQALVGSFQTVDEGVAMLRTFIARQKLSSHKHEQIQARMLEVSLVPMLEVLKELEADHHTVEDALTALEYFLSSLVPGIVSAVAGRNNEANCAAIEQMMLAKVARRLLSMRVAMQPPPGAKAN